jgi:hypothetical protein
MNSTMDRHASRLSDMARWSPLWLIAALALTGCGSGGGTMSPGPTPSTQACNDCGTAMVTLTDAPGDFLSYIVDVVSLQLKRSDGTLVEMVPSTTHVDFAQLLNLSEIVSVKEIPAGSYVSASITLDFSAATIVVDNGSGGVTIAAGNIINGATMQPLSAPNPTQMTLTLTLGTNDRLLVTPKAVANLALDFNLIASNAVAPSSANPATVTVNPVLTASLTPDTTKQIRVRGPLVSVNAGGNSFIVNVRPFYNASGGGGQFTVNTTGATTYSINGAAYAGSAGLTQLATLSAGTMMVSYGSWDRTTHVFTAGNVLAGSSVAGSLHDGVEGTVLSRTGDTLIVANGLVMHADLDDVHFARQVTATVGTATVVTEDGQSGPFSIQDISVGQHVQMSGTLGTDSSGNTTLDATGGSARLILTRLSGTVASVAANLVTLNLQSIDGHAASSFNFAGTGASSAQDAARAAYTVAVPPSLSTASLSAGVPVRFLGFVAPFGQAPPDFTALGLVNFANTRALLLMRWSEPGPTAPFATLTNAQMLINQATLQASVQHVIRVGFETIDPSTLTAGLQIVPDTAATNPDFAIGHLKSRTIDNFNTFNDFVTALTTDLDGTTGVVQLAADGPYAAATGVLSVDQMIVIVNN